MSTEVGMKFDADKPRYDLISPLATAYLAQVLSFGAQKYEAHNWRKGIRLSKILAACERHLAAMAAGIDRDSETGLPHAAHLMCEAMFFVELYTREDLDDRFHLSDYQKTLLEALLARNVVREDQSDFPCSK